MDHPLRELLTGGDLQPITAWLDAASHGERVEAMASLGRDGQRALWGLAEQASPLTLEDFVPAHVPVRQTVSHRGQNTLPLPAFGRRFTKAMARTGDGTIGGWNDSPLAWLVGPGFFVMRDCEPGEHPGSSVVVDYHRLPPADLPSSWPWRRPNWVGLQVLVYFHTRDYMRRVSNHVTIGLATKYGRSMGSWFVLVRDDEEVQ